MSKIKNLIIFFIILIQINSCLVDRQDNKLLIVNNKRINYFNFIEVKNKINIEDVSYIKIGNKFHYSKSMDSMYPLFALRNTGGYMKKINDECEDSTMHLFIFDVDSVKKYGWAKIINDEKLYFQKGFKVKDLDSLNWVIKIGDIVK